MANQLVTWWRQQKPEDASLSDDAITIKIANLAPEYKAQGKDLFAEYPDFARDYENILKQAGEEYKAAMEQINRREMQTIKQDLARRAQFNIAGWLIAVLLGFYLYRLFQKHGPARKASTMAFRWMGWAIVLIIPASLNQAFRQKQTSTIVDSIFFIIINAICYSSIAWILGWCYWKVFRSNQPTADTTTTNEFIETKLSEPQSAATKDIFDDAEFHRLNNSGAESLYERGCRYFLSNGNRVFVASSREFIERPTTKTASEISQRPDTTPAKKATTDIFDNGEFYRLSNSGAEPFFEQGCRYYVYDGKRVFVAASRDIITSSTPETNNIPQSQTVGSSSNKYHTVEERLTTLKKLLDQKLITQTDHDSKKREILREI